MSSLDKITQILDDFRQQKSVLYSQLRFEFAKVMAETLRKYGLAGFGWTQYTPYFNDGETCYFGVNCDPDYCKVQFHPGGDWVRSDDCYDHEDAISYGEDDLTIALRELCDIVYAFDNDFLQEAFGDHVEVRFSSDGTMSNEHYDHE